MAEENNADLPFLQYLVPEMIPGLPTSGRPCPSPAGDVSYFNGSPPSIMRGNHSLSPENLPLLPTMQEESIRRPDDRYGSINNEPDIVDHPVRSYRSHLWFKALKLATIIVVLTTFLFYAIGHGYKIYMQYDLSQLENFVALYKFYIITSYIAVIIVGFILGFCLHLVVQKLNQDTPFVSRSLNFVQQLHQGDFVQNGPLHKKTSGEKFDFELMSSMDPKDLIGFEVMDSEKHADKLFCIL
eukprot:TCALIF_08971-PA protein Name:"Protein of unknown function" AED:0.38 eAED:0.38 QI:0/0.5/0/0.66/1/1/3/0/240